MHDLRQARGVIAAARDEDAPLVVAYGHDHAAGVRREGSVVLVDAGTAGASGYAAIGAAREGAAGPVRSAASAASPASPPAFPASPPASPASPPAFPASPSETRTLYTFQLLDFSLEETPRLLGVTTLGYAADGRTVVEYTPVSG